MTQSGGKKRGKIRKKYKEYEEGALRGAFFAKTPADEVHAIAAGRSAKKRRFAALFFVANAYLFNRIAEEKAAVLFGEKILHGGGKARAAIIIKAKNSLRRFGKSNIMGGKIPPHIKDYSAAGRRAQKAAARKIKLRGRKVSLKKAKHKKRPRAEHAAKGKSVLKLRNEHGNFRRISFGAQKVVCGDKAAAAICRSACTAAQAKSALLLDKSIRRKRAAAAKFRRSRGGAVVLKISF